MTKTTNSISNTDTWHRVNKDVETEKDWENVSFTLILRVYCVAFIFSLQSFSPVLIKTESFLCIPFIALVFSCDQLPMSLKPTAQQSRECKV